MHDDTTIRLGLLEDGQQAILANQQKILEIVAYSARVLHQTSEMDEKLTSIELSILRNCTTTVERNEGKHVLTIDIPDIQALDATVTVQDGSGGESDLQFVPKGSTTPGTSPPPLKSIYSATVFRSVDLSTTESTASSLPFDPWAHSIINSLYSGAFYYREASIVNAHQETFQWIFKDTNFTKFLRESNGAYCISGKASSGKINFDQIHTRSFSNTGSVEEVGGSSSLIVTS